MAKLKKCPYCKEKKALRIQSDRELLDSLDIKRRNEEDYEGYFIICNYNLGGCGITSGWYKSKEQAKRLWNNRERGD